MPIVTLEEAYSAYLNQETLQSAHTLSAYRRAIDLFLLFLNDKKGQVLLPIQHREYTSAEQLRLDDFGGNDIDVFQYFVQWLLSESDGDNDKRPYALATVQLRLAGVLKWFHFMHNRGWLPQSFPYYDARQQVRDYLKEKMKSQKEKVVSLAEQDVEKVIYYYDTQVPPASLQKITSSNAERRERWELTRLRNAALLHCLAESGGRISEILGLNVSAFLPTAFEQKSASVKVIGKGQHPYQLQLSESLPALDNYLRRRQIKWSADDLHETPLFVSHDRRYAGQRMSRIVAWRIVHRASKALGLKNISPQDFRHWRAMKLLKEGHSQEEVRDLMGHRSVETIRTLYLDNESSNNDEKE